MFTVSIAKEYANPYLRIKDARPRIGRMLKRCFEEDERRRRWWCQPRMDQSASGAAASQHPSRKVGIIGCTVNIPLINILWNKLFGNIFISTGRSQSSLLTILKTRHNSVISNQICIHCEMWKEVPTDYVECIANPTMTRKAFANFRQILSWIRMMEF